VAVHSAGILAALTHIYGMTGLVGELTGKAVAKAAPAAFRHCGYCAAPR